MNLGRGAPVLRAVSVTPTRRAASRVEGVNSGMTAPSRRLQAAEQQAADRRDRPQGEDLPGRACPDRVPARVGRRARDHGGEYLGPRQRKPQPNAGAAARADLRAGRAGAVAKPHLEARHDRSVIRHRHTRKLGPEIRSRFSNRSSNGGRTLSWGMVKGTAGLNGIHVSGNISGNIERRIAHAAPIRT